MTPQGLSSLWFNSFMTGTVDSFFKLFSPPSRKPLLKDTASWLGWRRAWLVQGLVLGDVTSIELHTHWPPSSLRGHCNLHFQECSGFQTGSTSLLSLPCLSLSPAPSFLSPFLLPTSFCSLVCLPPGSPLWLQPGRCSSLCQRTPVLQSNTDKRVSAMKWRPGTSLLQITAHQLCKWWSFLPRSQPW